MPIVPAAATTSSPYVPTQIQQRFPLPGPDTGVRGIPAPPKPGGVVERAELQVLHVLQDKRTPEGIDWANRMAKDGVVKLWWQQAGKIRENQGVWQAVAGTAALGATLTANAVVTQVAKFRFNRDRPYDVDPTLTPAVPRPHDSSYPSGHASNAFAAARILSAFDPRQAVETYKLAAGVGYSRLYAGVHFPSDVAAGAALGTRIADLALKLIPGV